MSKKPFERIIVIMFENQYRQYVMQNMFMQKLAKAGADLTQFFGAFHPSQTNYLASLAGEVCAVTNDTPPSSPLMQETLVDLMEPAGLTWKAYMEAYPGDPWNENWTDPDYPSDEQPLNEFPDDGNSLARYFRKHNAFASFHNIQNNEERWNKIVSDEQFWQDVMAGDLPDYSWFTPDIWNDGHYLYNTHIDTNPRTQLIPQLSTWLEHVFLGNIATGKVQGGSESSLDNWGLNLDIDLLLTDPKKAWQQSHVPEGTLIVITFDEADFNADGYDTNYDGPNQVYTVLLGDMIRPGTVYDAPYNHYSLIKTIEKNYELGSLGKNDAHSSWIRPLWGERFQWGKVQETSNTGDNNLALSKYREGWAMVYAGDQQLMMSQWGKGTWDTASEIPFRASGPIALANLRGVLHLVFPDENGNLMTSKLSGGVWAEAYQLNENTAGDISMISFMDIADGREKLMLCWQGAAGFIYSLIYADGAWSESPVSVGQLTDGSLALGQLGPSLFLVYKERNTRGIRMTTYNLAPYNAFDALTFDDKPCPENNTSLHQWSPADMPVGNFSRKMSANKNEYLVLGSLALGSIEGELHLAHRGAYDDTPQAVSSFFGLTGIFTAQNQLTNGFGTMAQAGWTKELPLNNVSLDPESAIAMASNGKRLMLVWEPSGGGPFMSKEGCMLSS